MSQDLFRNIDFDYSIVNYVENNFILNSKFKVDKFYDQAKFKVFFPNVEFELDFLESPASLHEIEKIKKNPFFHNIISKINDFQIFLQNYDEEYKILKCSLKHHIFIPTDIRSLYFNLKIELNNNKSINLNFSNIKNNEDLINFINDEIYFQFLFDLIWILNTWKGVLYF